MDLRKAPLLLPAAALAAGALLAFELTWLPPLALAALVAAGLVLGRRIGVCLAFAALGALVAGVRLDLPHRPEEGLVVDRPVEAVIETTGHWTPDDDGWQAPARALSVRQGERVLTPPLALFVHLPDPEPPPLFGSRLRVAGYLIRSAPYGNRIAIPPGPWRLRVKSRLLMTVEEEPGAFMRLSGVLRRRVEQAYAAALPTGNEARDSRGRALARALVLGDTSGLPQPWRRGLRILGVYHIDSVSGLHVALLSGLVGLAAGWLPRPLR
ncbi:MAG TPA: ComEC/Rec2 family competence protein, partial [Thermoanaerobaculia bacterium]